MQYKIIQLENATLIMPKGEIDAYLVPEFKQVIEDQSERGNSTIIIDLKHVSYLDSSTWIISQPTKSYSQEKRAFQADSSKSTNCENI